MMDPWGSCRAIILPSRLSSYTGAVELSMVPCSWVLQFMCMEYATAQALSAGLTLPHNLYRTPEPPPLPIAVPSHSGSGGAPEGYRLVRSGVTLGYATAPAGAIPFSGRATYLQLGPIVNLVGRWRAGGLDALRVVAAHDATNVVERAMANGTVSDYFGDPTPVAGPTAATWAATPLPREDATAGVLRTTHVTRLEGCVSSTNVQRLVLVNAGGAAAAQGVTRCISNFAEEVVPGGFLAFVEGSYVDYTNSSVDPLNAAGSIVQLWFVWAVPLEYANTPDAGVSSALFAAGAAAPAGTTDAANGSTYGTGGVRAVAPRLAPLEPTAQCADSRPMIPFEGSIRNGAECGQTSLEQFACPSYMCCGTTRGRVGICGTLASACLLSACDPRYGLCGVLPNEALEVTPHEGLMGVAPAFTPLSSPPPYTTDYGGAYGNTATATVRYGSSVYVLDKSATVQYASAVDACRSQTLYGLSWRLIMLPDAFSYEVTLLGRSSFLSLLENRVAWVQPRPDDSVLGVPGCLTVTWDVDVGSVQLVTVQATECTSIASVICKATWPVPRYNVSTGKPTDGFGGPTRPSASLPPPAAQTRWTPGTHSLSLSLVGIGEPNSGNSCVFDTFGWLPTAEMQHAISLVSTAQLHNPAAAAPAVPLGINVTLDAPLVGLATRPLVTWSAVSAEPAAAYEVVASIAAQYLVAGAAAPSPPVVLGSLDGTYLSGNLSYGAVAPAGAAAELAAYLSAAGGWQTLQLDAAAGEVVVEAYGCRGALLEQLLLRTSTGRLWTVPIGPSLVCTVPFSRRAPVGGYLVALQVYAGSYVEEVKLVWGTPPPAAPPAAIAPRAAADDGGGSRLKRMRPAAFGASVGFAVLVPLLVAGIAVIWWVRRRRHRRRQISAAEAEAATVPSPPKLSGGSAAGPAASGGSFAGGAAAAPGGGCLGLLSIFVEGERLVGEAPAPHRTGCDAAAAAGITVGGGGGGPGTPMEPRGSSAGASPSSDATTLSSSGGGGIRTIMPLLADAPPPPSPPQQSAAAALAATTEAAAVAAGDGGGAGTTPAGVPSPGCGSRQDGGGGVAPRPPSSHMQVQPSDAHECGTPEGTCTGTGSDGEGGTSGSCDVGGPAARVDAVVVDGGRPGPGSTGSSTPQQPGARHEAAALVAAAAATATAVAAWTPPYTAASAAAAAAPSHPHPNMGLFYGANPPPLPPPGSDAWAQNLHAALFYKVLYHWKPPSLATPLVMPGLGPGGGGAPADVAPATATATGAGGAAGAAGTAPSLTPTPLAASSIAAPLTSSAAVGSAGSGAAANGSAGSGAAANGSAGSGATPQSSGLPPPEGTAAAAPTPPLSLTASWPPGSCGDAGVASACSGAATASERTVTPPVVGLSTAGTGCSGTSGIPNGAWPSLTAAAAAAVAGAWSSDAARRSRSGQAEALPVGALPPGAAAAAAPGSAAGVAAPAAAVDGLGSDEYDSRELLLGRDVLVDVDDPSSYLGHGTSGVVRRGLLRQSDGSWRPVAVKLLNQPSDPAAAGVGAAADAYRRLQKTLLQEITILGSLRHPNIVQLLGGSVSLHGGTGAGSFLVEELCGRALSHAIYDDSMPYSLRQVLRWCCDIARGLSYLHPNIMHRDLKPSNVLLDQYGTAKISDFGLARFKIHTTLVTRDAEVGTTCYMSPECFVSNDFKVTAACDVYSLGVMMNEMVTRTPPWAGVRTAVVGFKVAVVGDRPRLPEEGCALCPPALRHLIRDCWAQQPEERPTSAQVLARLQAMLAQLQREGEEAGEEGRAGTGGEAGPAAGRVGCPPEGPEKGAESGEARAEVDDGAGAEVYARAGEVAGGGGA